MNKTFILIFDPWCGWCYGAQPGLEKLAAAHPDAAWQLLPSGLFCHPDYPDADRRAYFWQADQKIAALTGQPFSTAYREQILGDATQAFDSSLTTLAWFLISRTAPEKSVAILHALQRLRYVDGDVSLAAHANVGEAFGIPAASLRTALAEPWPAELHALVGTARRLMQEHGLRGVPALLLTETGKQGQPQVLPSQLLY